MMKFGIRIIQYGIKRKKHNGKVKIELLISDFKNLKRSLKEDLRFYKDDGKERLNDFELMFGLILLIFLSIVYIVLSFEVTPILIQHEPYYDCIDLYEYLTIERLISLIFATICTILFINRRK